MHNKYNKENFLAYINNPMSKESVSVLFDSHNIKYEKCELYGDFVQSLLILIFDTYLGDDLTIIDDQFEHYNWCFNKVVDNFEEEGIVFESTRLYNYFLEFTLEVFYSNKDKGTEDFTDKAVLKIWSDVFNFTMTKTNSEVDTLIEIYLIFEKALKNTV